MLSKQLIILRLYYYEIMHNIDNIYKYFEGACLKEFIIETVA